MVTQLLSIDLLVIFKYELKDENLLLYQPKGHAYENIESLQN